MILALGGGLFAALLDFAYQMSTVKIRVRDLSTIRSRVQRSMSELSILENGATKVIIIDIQCFILFTIAERIAAKIQDNVSSAANIVLNFHEVNYLDQTGVEELARLLKALRASDNTVYATGFREELQNSDWLNLRERIGEEFILSDLDSALEICENKLISEGTSQEDLESGTNEKGACFFKEVISLLEIFSFISLEPIRSEHHLILTPPSVHEPYSRSRA